MELSRTEPNTALAFGKMCIERLRKWQHHPKWNAEDQNCIYAFRVSHLRTNEWMKKMNLFLELKISHGNTFTDTHTHYMCLRVYAAMRQVEKVKRANFAQNNDFQNHMFIDLMKRNLIKKSIKSFCCTYT